MHRKMRGHNDLCFTNEKKKRKRRSKTLITNSPLSQGCEPDTSTSLSNCSPGTSSDDSNSTQMLSSTGELWLL